MFGLISLGFGGSAAIGLVAWFGVGEIGANVLRALWVVPFTTACLAVQLYLSAIAWRISVGEQRPRVARYFRIRWIREAVNTLLPVAQLGGNLLGIRLLAQRGISGNIAGAGTALDTVIETATQVVFILAGFATLTAMDRNHTTQPWLWGTLLSMVLAATGFVLALRFGLLRMVEWLAERLQRFFPTLSLDVVRGLHRELMRLRRDRTAVARASALHLLAWFLGTAETWLVLTAMGCPTSLAEALVIESLGMAVRSAGFAVPGALGVQEAGFVLVGQLMGVPPDTAIALSMLKRARELLIGIPGLIAWQWTEVRRHLSGLHPLKE